MSCRHGVQLSWSIPSILQFHSRTFLNPSWAGREEKYALFLTSYSLVVHLHISLNVRSFHCNHRSWPWFSFAVSHSPLTSFFMWAQQLHGCADLTAIQCLGIFMSITCTQSSYRSLRGIHNVVWNVQTTRQWNHQFKNTRSTTDST